MIIYEERNFRIVKTIVPANRRYKVENLERPGENLHTHLRTLKEAKDLIHFAVKGKTPLHGRVDYLISLERIVTDKRHKEELHKLIDEKNRKKAERLWPEEGMLKGKGKAEKL